MNLLMLTKFFPFGTGEAFIENEITILSQYYDKVLIVACEVADTDSVVRELPSNVSAYKVPNGSKIRDFVRGVPLLFSNQKEIRDEKKYAQGVVQKLFLGYFESKSKRVFNYIIKNSVVDEFCTEPFVLYSYWFFMTARVGILISESYKPQYMFSRAHRYDLYENKNKIGYLPYRTLFLKSYHNVFPCSDNGTEFIRKKYGMLACNVHTSFLGTMDHGIARPSTDGIYRIVSCSRMEPLKRVSRIVDALGLLEGSDIAIEWTHIGSGSQFEEIKKRANEKLKNITFSFVGNMKNADVMELYRTYPFDLLINVSNSEGLPVSIMEGISFGIPAIGTDVGGTSEIVKDGITGKLIEADFKDSQLAEIIYNFAIGGDMSVSRQSCRKFWEEHFQAIPNYKELCHFINERCCSGKE